MRLATETEWRRLRALATISRRVFDINYMIDLNECEKMHRCDMVCARRHTMTNKNPATRGISSIFLCATVCVCFFFSYFVLFYCCWVNQIEWKCTLWMCAIAHRQCVLCQYAQCVCTLDGSVRSRHDNTNTSCDRSQHYEKTRKWAKNKTQTIWS